MCPSISPDCHLLVLELVLVLRYHFISSGQINTHRCSMHCAVLSRFSHVQLFVTLWTVAHQLPLSMGFSRQGYWSGLPFPSPGSSSWPSDRTQVSCIAGRLFAIWAVFRLAMSGYFSVIQGQGWNNLLVGVSKISFRMAQNILLKFCWHISWLLSWWGRSHQIRGGKQTAIKQGNLKEEV